jgi:hypothetical protein
MVSSRSEQRHPRRRDGGAPSGGRPARGPRRSERPITPVDLERDDEDAWFGPPWQDGRNAVRLVEALGIAAGAPPLPALLQRIVGGDPEALSTVDYDAVNELAYEASREARGIEGDLVPIAAAILANWIARSDGGGHVPNVHLRGFVGRILWRGWLPSPIVRWTIGVWRARDLGIDRDRPIFMTRWEARQYKTAWAMPRH